MVYTKEETKKGIAELVKKYERIVDEDRLGDYDEANTRRDFIEPFFNYLNWDVYNKERTDEATEEERISHKKVDYAFRIGGIPKFYLEAKGIRENLDIPKWAVQAIDYSWHKDVTWAVLSDFEGLKVFNAEWKTKTPQESLFFELKWNEYLDRFDQIWLLSRESIEKGELDKEAEKWGKKRKKRPIGEQFFNDLMDWRKLLTKGIAKYPRVNKLTEDERDESVQKILDRLIFIRVCEDRGIEPVTLHSGLREWKDYKRGKSFSQVLKNIFRKFDSYYNSDIFRKHVCEDLRIDDDILERIIDRLYESPDKTFRYNFRDISPDVMGSIYEQYLGYLLKKKEPTKKRRRRKEMGIYYTPTHIVAYIVKNTLGEVLKRTKPKDIAKIKVLDPACGSGSFLIKAFDLLCDFYTKHRRPHGPLPAFAYLVKTEILKNNLYGVDLDSRAVEIAQLNSLLKTLYQRAQLPEMSEKIKCGNSLISGTEKELKEYFDDPKEKRPFNWKEEFSEVFQQGGFDVVIGNPPYVSFYSRESFLDHYKDELDWLIANYTFTQKYQDRRLNTVMFFLERGLDLLKVGGYLGFIVDANFIEKPSRAIRKFIDDSNVEIKISKKISVFKDVGSDQVIVVFRKQESKSRRPINIIDYDFDKKQFFVLEETVNRSEFRNDMLNLNINRIALSTQHKLSDIADISTGVQIGIGGTRTYKGKKIEDLFYRNKQAPGFYKNVSLHPKDFFRYSPVRIKNYINLNEKLAYEINKLVAKCNIAVTKAEGFKDEDKIFIRQSSDRIVATLGYKGQVCEYSAFMLKTENPSDLKYVLALLNSRLLSFYALQENIILTGGRKQPQIRIKGLKLLPMPTEVSDKRKMVLLSLAQQMLDLNKKLQSIAENTDKWYRLKREIEKLNRSIDQEIYELYGLTNEEQKIIEESLK